MIAADTNLMVRILVDDPGQPEQVTIARMLASEAKQIFVAQIVAVEVVWVLQSAYKLDKLAIVQLLAVGRGQVSYARFSRFRQVRVKALPRNTSGECHRGRRSPGGRNTRKESNMTGSGLTIGCLNIIKQPFFPET